MRYFHRMKLDYWTAHERLTRMCFIDYDRQMALVAEQSNQILAVGRLIRERELCRGRTCHCRE
jgi:acetyltransferase